MSKFYRTSISFQNEKIAQALKDRIKSLCKRSVTTYIEELVIADLEKSGLDVKQLLS